MFTYERVTCLFKYQLDYIILSASLEWVVDAELFSSWLIYRESLKVDHSSQE